MVDWSKWVPGWPEAASSVEQVGPERLVAVADALGVPLGDLSKRDQRTVSELLAAALSTGSSTSMEKELRVLFGDRPRAATTTNTLLAWAMSAQSLANYRSAKMKAEWLAVEGSCETCIANVEIGPVTAGEAFPSGHPCPPAHPDCRCALTPVVALR
jgi:hypothetical protein